MRVEEKVIERIKEAKPIVSINKVMSMLQEGDDIDSVIRRAESEAVKKGRQ